jgi:putative endonuclease
MKQWCVYLLICADNSIYTGMTNDIEKRVKEHNTGNRGAKYTKTRRPVKLLKVIPCENRTDSLRLEYKIKRLSHNQKLKL